MIPYSLNQDNAFLKFWTVTTTEMKTLLSKLESSKAPGPDGVGLTELNMAADQIVLLLTILFDESLMTGKLPNEFKFANLFPLLNSKSPSSC